VSQSNDIVVRALRRDDHMAWRALWTAYLAFYNTTVNEQVYATTFERLLGDDVRDFSALVAEVDGNVVGITHYLFHRHAWRVEEVCYLQDLYAAPDVRGQGVGRALIEGVYAAADSAGAGTVYWLTQEFNDTARRLYDRIGVVTPFLKYQRS
jgi:GNAT superfamily N-acetyltransferase